LNGQKKDSCWAAPGSRSESRSGPWREAERRPRRSSGSTAPRWFHPRSRTGRHHLAGQGTAHGAQRAAQCPAVMTDPAAAGYNSSSCSAWCRGSLASRPRRLVLPKPATESVDRQQTSGMHQGIPTAYRVPLWPAQQSHTGLLHLWLQPDLHPTEKKNNSMAGCRPSLGHGAKAGLLNTSGGQARSAGRGCAVPSKVLTHGDAEQPDVHDARERPDEVMPPAADRRC
jgi:hypothetical protein